MTKTEFKAFSKIVWNKIKEPIIITIVCVVMASWLPIILHFTSFFYGMSNSDKWVLTFAIGIGGFIASIPILCGIEKLINLVKQAIREAKDQVRRETILREHQVQSQPEIPQETIVIYHEPPKKYDKKKEKYKHEKIEKAKTILESVD